MTSGSRQSTASAIDYLFPPFSVGYNPRFNDTARPHWPPPCSLETVSKFVDRFLTQTRIRGSAQISEVSELVPKDGYEDPCSLCQTSASPPEGERPIEFGTPQLETKPFPPQTAREANSSWDWQRYRINPIDPSCDASSMHWRTLPHERSANLFTKAYRVLTGVRCQYHLRFCNNSDTLVRFSLGKNPQKTTGPSIHRLPGVQTQSPHVKNHFWKIQHRLLPLTAG